MIPTNLNDQKLWIQSFYKNRKRTSDRFLFYTKGFAGYLLIAIVQDPGGHAVLNQKETILVWDQIAKYFAIYGKVV
jgi:hypothetical protein